MAKVDLNSVNKKKSNSNNDTKKLVIIGIAVVLILIVGVLTFISFKYRKKNATSADFMAGKTTTSSTSKTSTASSGSSTVKPATGTTSSASEDNTPDEAKIKAEQEKQKAQQQLAGKSLKDMDQDQKLKALKDSFNNTQTKDDAFVTEDVKKNTTMALPVPVDSIQRKSAYVNYIKHVSKTDDRMFVMWLEATYNTKKYYLTVNSDQFNALPDTGIVVVDVEYYVDKQNLENTVSVSIRSDFKEVLEKTSKTKK